MRRWCSTSSWWRSTSVARRCGHRLQSTVTRAEVLTVAGPAGPLETRLEFPDVEGEPRVFGVACHPHPLFGGTMDNKVTHVLARAMTECGAPAYRFNFR